MKVLAVLLTLLVFQTVHAQSQDISIVNVRKNITLSNEETAYRDYYLNGGSDDGIKKGQVLNIVRKVVARDYSGTQTYGDIFIPVGELKVIAVFGKLAVARESKIFSREELPVLEQIGLMTGDLVDLRNQFSPTGKK
ncbi:MAG: hypothetical protein V4736_16155 [Bdellovibrionota bacterium]